MGIDTDKIGEVKRKNRSVKFNQSVVKRYKERKIKKRITKESELLENNKKDCFKTK